MSKGNTIVLTGNPKGNFLTGIVSGALLPGTLVEIKATAMVNGLPTFEAFAPGTDGQGKPIGILMEDSDQGKLITDAYVDGKACQVYCPLPGDDVNALLGEVAGTGNTYAIADRLIVDAEDGILVPFTGSPADVYGICMETLTQVAGSHLTWIKVL
jgi:hypothetical protein